MLIHSKNRHYLTFYILKIDQLQFTRMFQEIKNFLFIYIQLSTQKQKMLNKHSNIIKKINIYCRLICIKTSIRFSYCQKRKRC